MPRAPASKLAISVDRDVYAKVIKAAAHEGMSVSAWITAAARQALV
jgi:predicted HicB family RNase H-like nuclease